MRQRWMVLLFGLLLLTPGCIGNEDTSESSDVLYDEQESVTLDVWHSFTTDSKEENVFLDAIESFDALYPNITVDVTQKPFSTINVQFEIASIAGEAPDLVRLSNDQYGSLIDIRTEGGYPILEDLRPHLTPAERESFDVDALNSMRFNNSLYGIPSSRDCLSLIYNKALFDAEGLSYPNENWTTSDLLSAAENLTNGDVHGLALPVQDPYWWFPFQTGFGGSLFDSDGTPTLDSNGSAASMDWLMDLERERELIALGTKADGMKSQFIQSKAAMIIDGPWNWPSYEASRLNIGQELLPVVEETGLYFHPGL